MLNWRARNPSTASVMPATTKTMNAQTVLSVEISQMRSGTRKSRLMEMRLGIVIGWPIRPCRRFDRLHMASPAGLAKEGGRAACRAGRGGGGPVIPDRRERLGVNVRARHRVRR